MPERQRRNGYMTGMQGVYLVAAELTKRGLTVAPNSRSSFGADLLVTDEGCKKAWSVQVKANYGRPKFWLLNKHSKNSASSSHIYVLVNLSQANARQQRLGPEFYVVPSRIIARRMHTVRRKTGAVFHAIRTSEIEKCLGRWSILGGQVS